MCVTSAIYVAHLQQKVGQIQHPLPCMQTVMTAACMQAIVSFLLRQAMGAGTGGGQGGQAPTLEKIRVGIAHPGNFSRGLFKDVCMLARIYFACPVTQVSNARDRSAWCVGWKCGFDAQQASLGWITSSFLWHILQYQLTWTAWLKISFDQRKDDFGL